MRTLFFGFFVAATPMLLIARMWVLAALSACMAVALFKRSKSRKSGRSGDSDSGVTLDIGNGYDVGGSGGDCGGGDGGGGGD